VGSICKRGDIFHRKGANKKNRHCDPDGSGEVIPAKLTHCREGFSVIYVMGWKLFSIYNPSPTLLPTLREKGVKKVVSCKSWDYGLFLNNQYRTPNDE
jgi:hypothetical protein